jgi:antitoxin (DNA-binding transcriptional repressor) of toxin-antitoxin stability system
MLFMAKPMIHISEAETAADFAGVLARVRAGAEIIIDGQEPIVVAVRSQPPPGRLLSESIALAEAHGSSLTLDQDFARDLEAVINK